MEKDIFKDKFLSDEISKEKEFVYDNELFNNNLKIINSYCNNDIINNESIILLIKTFSIIIATLLSKYFNILNNMKD